MGQSTITGTSHHFMCRLECQDANVVNVAIAMFGLCEQDTASPRGQDAEAAPLGRTFTELKALTPH